MSLQEQLIAIRALEGITRALSRAPVTIVGDGAVDKATQTVECVYDAQGRQLAELGISPVDGYTRDPFCKLLTPLQANLATTT